MCISINSPWLFAFSQYPRKKYWSSATSYGDSISTYFNSSCSTCLTQIIFLIMIRISSSFIIITCSYIISPSLNMQSTLLALSLLLLKTFFTGVTRGNYVHRSPKSILSPTAFLVSYTILYLIIYICTLLTWTILP